MENRLTDEVKVIILKQLSTPYKGQIGISEKGVTVKLVWGHRGSVKLRLEFPDKCVTSFTGSVEEIMDWYGISFSDRKFWCTFDISWRSYKHEESYTSKFIKEWCEYYKDSLSPLSEIADNVYKTYWGAVGAFDPNPDVYYFLVVNRFSGKESQPFKLIRDVEKDPRKSEKYAETFKFSA